LPLVPELHLLRKLNNKKAALVLRIFSFMTSCKIIYAHYI
jgi:hypothetical protein